MIVFLEITMQVDEYNLQMEKMTVGKNANRPGKALLDSNIRREFNVILIVLWKRAQIVCLKKGLEG